MPTLGQTTWAISSGRIPFRCQGPEPEMTSHETLCLLNSSKSEAKVEITLYYEDRDPIGPYPLKIPAQRTRHVRVNDLIDPEAPPLETNYSALVHSDVPIVVQFSRLDSSQAANAQISTIAFPCD